jgi:hypothetical protein
MAVLTIAAFLSKWGTTNFPSTGNRSITAVKMRDFRQDIADSFQSVLGATTITSWKSPCAVATTTNITLSGEQTIDGVLTSSSRVLVKDQTSTLQNGIYVSAAGAWARATDADSAGELEGAAVGVTQGTVQQNTIWIQTTDNITLETSAIAWQQSGYGSGVTLIDDDTFATASATTAPSSESVKAYVDNAAITLEVDVSSAQILNSNSVPVALVAAPGANKFIRVIDIAIRYTFVSAAYATNTNLLFMYSALVAAAVDAQPSSVLTQTNNRIFMTGGISPTGTPQGYINLDNQGIVLYTQTGNPTAGSGTIKVFITYKILDFA